MAVLVGIRVELAQRRERRIVPLELADHAPCPLRDGGGPGAVLAGEPAARERVIRQEADVRRSAERE